MWCDRNALLGPGVAVSTDPALARALAPLASDDWPASNYLLIVRCPAVFRQVQSVDPCLSPQHLCADCKGNVLSMACAIECYLMACTLPTLQHTTSNDPISSITSC
jgi:hypothetical protein